MKIFTEYNLQDFTFWSGAISTAEMLSARDFHILEDILSDLYPDGVDETTINDIFWFEEDWVAEMLGYGNWEELEADREDD